ncbi:MAG: class A beta-lactamase-related serine hydrolase [Negativicutes bacterium]|nr:class A beta-lactamase-related serine hydrolase [Negativicutes bacterium]
MKKLLISGLIFSLLSCSAAFAAPNPAQEIINDVKNFNGKAGVYAMNLKSGRSLAYNDDVVFPTASTSKLVVALAVYKYLYSAAPQDKRDLYDRDVEAMITVSDNDSFAELLGELDASKPEALSLVLKDLRLKRTLIHSETAFKSFGYHSVTTPREMANVMETLYRDRYLGKPRSTALKDELANTIFHDEIPRYMLTKVMHKVGELDNVLCDVGIVDDGKDQILISIYTTSTNPDTYASDFIATTSAKLYNALRKK